MPKTITVSIAINDRNGEWSDYVRLVNFGFIDANPHEDELKAIVIENKFCIDHKQFPFIRQIPWYGNMSFEGFVMTVEIANDLANYLRRKGYQPEYGECDVWEDWESGATIDFNQCMEQNTNE